ncbi:DUF2863 family protein [Pusillimonas sp. TS35]|uniref:DUF2863 family protein n=1 Tax=Paracandidimonas lactea TaxID=2895524 RepID=UPI001370C9D2|nr:DUF2863 family protein [Paracandidimonas lactea]MYN13737.1 DUF2863 family protein [Pusillimonas sp. TS35]
MSAPSPSRFSRDTQRLLALAAALARSGSRLEDAYWENLLGVQLNKLLLGKKNKYIEAALDHLSATDSNAYEILIEQAETLSESTQIQVEGVEYDVLLFSAPLVAWTRYKMPGIALTADQNAQLLAHVKAYIAAPAAKVALLPALVGFDQMPQTFQETRQWTQRLAQQALGVPAETCTLHSPTEPDTLLADARFVVGAIAVPKGEALFRWQTPQAEDGQAGRDLVRNAWIDAASTVISPLFTGCQVEFLQPDAYYINSREADRRIRPLALKAAITWLQAAVHLTGAELRAVIAGCGESAIEEYRVGFSTRQNNDVIYGCVWPVLSREEAVADGMESGEIDVPDEIAALLKEQGVGDVRRLPGLYPIEFCDDCGAPLFPNALGEMMHPELPEEADMTPIHFH